MAANGLHGGKPVASSWCYLDEIQINYFNFHVIEIPYHPLIGTIQLFSNLPQGHVRQKSEVTHMLSFKSLFRQTLHV